jgi:uncharacterized RDD family membrane protein YckC
MEATAAHRGSAIDDSRLAPRTHRLVAWVLDAFILGVLVIPFDPILYSHRPRQSLFLALFVPGLLLAFLYMVLFDGGRKGATLGKRIIGIRVVDAETREAIGYRRATVRRVVYIVGGLVLYLGWLWMLFDPRRQAWHDKAAGTVVLKAR